jgi:MtN3 and saliva related transmembrane protein
MTSVDLLGLVAGALTTISFVPQVIKVWRTRSAGDFSYVMLALFCTGIACWLLYGVAVRSLPVVLANGVTLALTLAIFWLKTRYR